MEENNDRRLVVEQPICDLLDTFRDYCDSMSFTEYNAVAAKKINNTLYCLELDMSDDVVTTHIRRANSRNICTIHSIHGNRGYKSYYYHEDPILSNSSGIVDLVLRARANIKESIRTSVSLLLEVNSDNKYHTSKLKDEG